MLCEASVASELGVALHGETPAWFELTRAALAAAAGCAAAAGDAEPGGGDCLEVACAAWLGGDVAAEGALRAFLGQALRHQPDNVGAAERAPRLAVGARDEVWPAVSYLFSALRVRRELDDLVAGRHGGRLRVRAVQ